MTFDLQAILQHVEQATPSEDLPEWLHRSWTEPAAFTAALASAHAGRGAPLKSRAGQHHDFFHDLVGRHATTNLVALRTYERPHGWRTLSYRQLHEQATRRATAWEQRGVRPGARVCLLLHPSPELWVSLCAALCLGARVSLLPPTGTRFVSRRLAALAPEHVVAEPHQTPLLGTHARSLLPLIGASTPTATSHSYKPEEPVGLLFSPLSEPSWRPVPLKAADAWLGALVDGLLTFALAPGDHLAAPGLHPLQHLPALIFSTLLRGATFLHLEPSDLDERPSLLTEHPVRALGVSPALRDLLLRTRTPLVNVEGWFRDPETSLDGERWHAWVQQCGLSSVPCSNVLVDATAGGAVLCSPRRVGDVHAEAAPAPGRRWALKDLNRSGQQAPADVGLFTLLPEEGRPPGHVVLSRVRQQYLHAGSRDARREGRVISTDEVTEALDDLEPPVSTSLLILPTGGPTGAPCRVLLVFTGEAPRQTAPLLAEVRRRLEQRLGPEHLPDRVEIFPLYPRLRDGRVDPAWCRTQYLTGSLHRKATDPLFQTLTALRARLRPLTPLNPRS
ncbi:AMP-binding protein [Myxococcus fulvus]|uniref:AMP-binding protein n=1 Tax=Myxococcus fulvus TaxID=33 RepID=UPI003B9D705D